MMTINMICAVAQVLLVVLLLALLAYVLRSVAFGLRDLGATPRQITKKTNAELAQITKEGMREMDNLGEQYLRDIFYQVTDSTNQRR